MNTHLKTKKLLLCAALSLWATGAAAQTARPGAETHAPGRLLAMPRAGLSAQDIDRVLRSVGGQGRRVGSSNLYIVDVPRGSERAIANKLAHNPHFKFAELDQAMAPELAPNDPYAGSQWHLAKIAATSAWDASQGSGVTIAILDSGVDATHADLASRIVAGWNFYDNNSNTADVHGHGTSVAGAAAAATNNGMGVAAVAGQAKIMPIRIADASGYAYWSTLAQGITYAADRGVRVANASFAASGSSAVQSAAQYMKNKGGLVFVAAGNQAAALTIPATSSLITVAATTSSDERASYSNYGAVVALAAPGSGIYTTVRGGSYASVSGTSAASPVAAAVAALVMAARPGLSSAAVEQLLFTTAADLGSAGKDPYYGHGRVDAGAAVAAALGAGTAPPPADTTAPTVAIVNPLAGSSLSGLAAVDVHAGDNVGVTKVELRVNGSLVASDTGAPFAFSWDTKSLANGSASLEARAYDAAGNVANSSKVNVSVANLAPPADTTSPTVAILNPAAGSTVKGTVGIKANATDNAGEAGLSQTLYINGAIVASSSTGSLSYNWNTRKARAGTHQIQVVARDAAGNSSSRAVTVYK
jgi:thermitase